MGIGASKEGFSVFGMLNKCVSPLGKRRLKLWFLRPIVNISVLQQRQAAVSAFMRIPDHMKHIQVVSFPWDMGSAEAFCSLKACICSSLWRHKCNVACETTSHIALIAMTDCSSVKTMARLQAVLRKIKDVPKQLHELKNKLGGFKVADFRSLQESAANMLMLKEALTTASQVCCQRKLLAHNSP